MSEINQELNSRYNSQDHYRALRDDYKTPPQIYEPLLKYFKKRDSTLMFVVPTRIFRQINIIQKPKTD